MDFAIALKDSLVTWQTDQGAEVRGNLMHVNRYGAVFEVYESDCVLQVSQVLPGFKIHRQDRPIYDGRAVVQDVINTGLAVHVRASLDEAWLDLGMREDLQPRKISEQFQTFFKEWQKNYRIRKEYKVAVADIQTYLLELHSWMEQLEMALPPLSEAGAPALETSTLRELERVCLPSLNVLFDKFEAVAGTIEGPQQPFHRNYTKRQLHPLVLCAPFVNRTFFKPLGFAGDYEMVNMIARHRHEGPTLFGKLVNAWFLHQAPAVAHRNRIEVLTRRLVEETARAAGPRLTGTARILNLGCGPAVELQHFFADHPICDHTDITLLDFNQETIAHAQAALREVSQAHHRGARVQAVQKSVQQILRESGQDSRRDPTDLYDFIYCAGLFDYLSDPVCQRLISTFHRRLRPEGLLLLTNVDDYNPRRHTMEAVLEWNLIYRNHEGARRLLPADVPEDQARIHADLSGVNIFIEIRKPPHA